MLSNIVALVKSQFDLGKISISKILPLGYSLTYLMMYNVSFQNVMVVALLQIVFYQKKKKITDRVK